ncbi:hypothetical protein ABW19_dt0207902 [Dactylella cylindrospora]|nr:hypothetical protein ABW19_dt0207902 [Dactylella cylindrospora]
MSSSTSSTAVSAPGKVLLAGGYTVLDPKCRGLVFALSARIHAIAVPLEGGEGKITVRSPQFKDAVWEYEIKDLGDGRGVSVSQLNTESSSNPFVQTTLKYVLSYLSLSTIPSATITILADNDYYSQPPPPIPRFNNLSVPIKSAYKTGLGSSAALVTSLTTCLLYHYSPNPKSLEIHVLHNLAQAAHCAAQGKVGSGFDVAAATYGSCQYQRFDPSVLTAVGEPGTPTFVTNLQSTTNATWDMTCTPIKVPKPIGLVMGDVQCGSATPGMVKTVLEWRKKHEKADDIWQGLDKANRELIASIVNLSESKGEMTVATSELEDIKAKRIPTIRGMIRTMGELAGVPIEPPSQTALLDAASVVPEVIGGVVPGAGGYDAVCFLYVDDEDAGERLRKFLREYKLDNGYVRPLDAREESEGVRAEDIKGYEDVKHYFEGIL